MMFVLLLENKYPQVYTLCTLVGYMLEYLCMVLSCVVVVLLLARDCHYSRVLNITSNGWTSSLLCSSLRLTAGVERCIFNCGKMTVKVKYSFQWG